MKRPKSHYRSGKYKDIRKTSSPDYCEYKPDLDNLIKFIADALGGPDGFYLDDCQIVEIKAEKHYATKSELPKTVIMIDKYED